MFFFTCFCRVMRSQSSTSQGFSSSGIFTFTSTRLVNISSWTQTFITCFFFHYYHHHFNMCYVRDTLPFFLLWSDITQHIFPVTTGRLCTSPSNAQGFSDLSAVIFCWHAAVCATFPAASCFLKQTKPFFTQWAHQQELNLQSKSPKNHLVAHSVVVTFMHE